MTAITPPGQSEDAAASLHNELTAIVREEIGLNESLASQFALLILRGIRQRLGGQELYIPTEDRAPRDAAIRAEFNGRNRDEICRKYGISRSGLYKILGR